MVWFETMKGGKGNFRGPKWGPLMASVPPDSPNFAQEINPGGGHSFLNRANAPPLHLSPAPPDLQSPRRGGQNFHQQGVAVGHHPRDLQWGTPSPPGVSPRGHHSHPQQRRGFRTPPNIPGHNAPPPMPPGHLNGGAMWHPNAPIQMSSAFPLNEMEQHERGRRATMMSPTESPSFPPSWVEGAMGPIGHFQTGGLPPGDNRLAYVDRVASGAHNDLRTGKKAVTSATVAQATLLALGVPAFEAVGIVPQDIPCLRQLTTLEGRV